LSEKMIGARAITECMKLEGVKHVFCVPGESYLALMDAIYDTDIQLISARHESGAAFMAEAYAKATGRVGVAMATRAVGGSNLAIGVHTAFQDSTPLVVFLGQVERQFRGREGFQEIDLERFFGHMAKWAVEVKDAQRIPEIVQRAFRIARTGRPGPVVISLPEDVLRDTCTLTLGPPVQIPKPRPSLTEVKEVFALLQEAKRPLLIAGGGVKAANGEASLIAFAEKYGIPVMAAFRRQDVFPNDHPLYVGHLGLGTYSSIIDTVKQADLVIAVGTRLSEVTTQDYSIFNHRPKLIHIDIDYSTLGKVYQPDIGILADAAEALHALVNHRTKGVPMENWGSWARQRREIYQKTTVVKECNAAMDLGKAISTLQALLPGDAIITNDAGNFAGWLHQYFQFNRRKMYIGPTSGAMGYGLPAAIGAKLACPYRTVVCLAGDGGFMMTMSELETVVRYQIPVICIVFNNRMFGTIRMYQERQYPNRVIGTDLTDIDFAALAKALQCNSYQVSTNQAFEAALRDALTQTAPSVIEIKADPEHISVQSSLSEIKNK
jgi:acetolactate synthase-1/2/3 large subunit